MADSVIYTAATVLLSARLCLDNSYLEGIDEDWSRALDYLKSISSKSISADRCLKLLEVMDSQLRKHHFSQPFADTRNIFANQFLRYNAQSLPGSTLTTN
jgi:hypothetical protein